MFSTFFNESLMEINLPLSSKGVCLISLEYTHKELGKIEYIDHSSRVKLPLDACTIYLRRWWRQKLVSRSPKTNWKFSLSWKFIVSKKLKPEVCKLRKIRLAYIHTYLKPSPGQPTRLSAIRYVPSQIVVLQESRRHKELSQVQRIK